MIVGEEYNLRAFINIDTTDVIKYSSSNDIWLRLIIRKITALSEGWLQLQLGQTMDTRLCER